MCLIIGYCKSILWKQTSVLSNIARYIVNVALHNNSSPENLELSFVLTKVHSLYRYRKHHIEHLLTLTDSFTWEELPTRDVDNGHLTKAAYIPVIQRLTIYAVWFIILFNLANSIFRIVTERGMIFNSWFPFDISVTTVYVTANIIQVGSIE
jgi:hypothetical protein